MPRLKTSATWARSCQPALAGVLAALALSAPGTADARSRLQGVGQVSLGYTDNARSAPDEAIRSPEDPSQVLVPAKKADALAILSPGVVYAIENPGSVHRFSYLYSTTLFFENTTANVASNRLEWRGFFEPTPRLHLITSASATQSHHNTSGTLLSSSQTALGAAVPGTGAYVLASGDESLTYSLSPRWAFLQGLAGAVQVPVFDSSGPKTYQLVNRLGIEHLWEVDAVGAEARARYVTFKGGALTRAGTRGDQSQIIAEAVATWRHDWTYEISSRAEAGVARAELITRNREFWQPVGLAGLAYTVDEGQAELTYRHAITTSVFLGLTFLTDDVRLHGTIPLDRHDRLFISASAGYQRSRILEATGDLATHLQVVLGDVGIGYRVLDELELAARYQHVQQVSGADLPPLPLSYVRNTALITATLEYPPDRDMPSEVRQTQRVERSQTLDNATQTPAQTVPGGGFDR